MSDKERIFDELMELVTSLKPSNNIPFEGKINETTRLIEDLGFDSISIIRLIVEIESKYGIIVNEDDLLIDRLNNLSLLSDLVNTLLEIKNEQ